MKVLIIARSKDGRYAPFIAEQVGALRERGVVCEYFGVDNNGIIGYLRHLSKLKRITKAFRPDIIHAHYGLCGVLANLQRSVPVVTTYHGSDINDPRVLRASRWAIRESAFNIFVSQKNVRIAKPRKNNYEVIPCGINLEDYPIITKAEARKEFGLESDKKYVLFSSGFDNTVKNYPLAKAAVDLIPEAKLLELKGYNRYQVATLMQAADALIMTSFTEGSPQVIKEALVCGCPIVSVDVGDVKEMVNGVEGCIIAERSPESIADGIKIATSFRKRTEGRNIIIKKGLTNDIIALKLINIFNSLIHK